MKHFIFSMIGLMLLAVLVFVIAWFDAKKRRALSRERLAKLEAEERLERELEARSLARRANSPVSLNGRHKTLSAG